MQLEFFLVHYDDYVLCWNPKTQLHMLRIRDSTAYYSSKDGVLMLMLMVM